MQETWDTGLIPRSGRSRVGNFNPFQYSCLENSMGRGAWQAMDHGVTKSQTRLKQLSRQRAVRKKAMNEAEVMWRVSTIAELWVLQESEVQCVYHRTPWEQQHKAAPTGQAYTTGRPPAGSRELHPPSQTPPDPSAGGRLQAPSLTAWLMPSSPHKVQDKSLIPFGFLGHGLFLPLKEENPPT